LRLLNDAHRIPTSITIHRRSTAGSTKYSANEFRNRHARWKTEKEESGWRYLLSCSAREEVKFSVKPKHKGSFTVGSGILYLDENGKGKSHQPEPLTITVKELGIEGWITGEA